MKKQLLFLFSILSLNILPSCSTSLTGTIYFDLEGGYFADESFSTTYLTGTSNTPVLIDIPTPIKDGYFFVGWREKTKSGEYRSISKTLLDDGKTYYLYPYGEDTFYAYFEPLIKINFDLGEIDADNIIAPNLDSENFVNNCLNGYAAKSIVSLNYLPTVDTKDSHLTFQYWYIKYPLGITVDEKNDSHYFLDTSKEEGIYRFENQFRNGMEFLIEDFTLYAYYTEDATITVNFNIENMEPYSFKAKDNIKEELTAIMKERFDIDYSLPSEYYYYEDNKHKYRFNGFYLDEACSKIFTLNATISDLSFSIYLDWDIAIDITLDLNGGKINDEEEIKISQEYYSSDYLSSEFLSKYTPTKENATFNNYLLNDEVFSFTSTKLPRENITLVANYTSYPILTLKYDLPASYTGNTYQDKTYYLKSGSDLTTYLNEFKSEINDDSLIIDDYYQISNGKLLRNQLSIMSNDDLTLYLVVNYKSTLTIKTYLKNEGNVTYYSDKTLYFNNTSYSLADLNLNDKITDTEIDYLYEDIYLDVNFTQKAVFPLYLDSSHNEVNNLNLYVKMEKAVTLTFIEDSSSSIIGTIEVLPNSKVSSYLNEINNLLGSYSYLVYENKKISNYLPTVDATIRVVR